MFSLFCAGILLTGLSIAALALGPTFFPRIGLWPFVIGPKRAVRGAQMALAWLLTALAWRVAPVGWGWVPIALASWVSVLAMKLYARNIFVALHRPPRQTLGLAEATPVLAVEIAQQVVAYPIELVVPHHVINDEIHGQPILLAW